MSSGPPAARRPFYSDFAWAFNLLVERPVSTECDAIAAWLMERGVQPGADLLDAGCGTGHYAIELSRRGYVVHGIDASPELIAEANRSMGSVDFRVGNILSLPRCEYDAILCRGVLNDLLDDSSRHDVFVGFAQALRPGGVLILDVREWEATSLRKAQEPIFRKTVTTERGRLTFTSLTELDSANRCLLISECHTLSDGGEDHSRHYSFVMRCWTRDEIQLQLQVCGFTSMDWFGGYDPETPPGTTDRLVVVAQLPFQRSRESDSKSRATLSSRGGHRER